MPVASSQKDAQNQLLQHYQHLLPKSPTYHLGSQLSPGSLVPSSEHFIGREEGATFVSDLRPLTALQASASSERNASFFSTHSPPLINLSPNLSPTAEPQRVSPFYDLRETTRRRSFYDFQNSCSQPMQNPAQICSGRHVEDTSRKSESPSRKRRKTSNSYIDLTNHSPSPPPTWSRERTEAERLGVSRRRVSSQRRVSGDSRRLIAERSNTPRARRSPGTRRRTRDRNPTPQNESGQEPRAFQPPHLMNPRQIHPASLHPHHLHGAPQQVMFEMEQVPVSTPVSMAPYAIPVCAGPHLPVCTGAHHPVCSTAPTWSIPGCSVQLPSCNMQHIPACSLPQIPFHPSSIPPLFHHHHHHPAASHIPPQHLAPPTHFNPSARGLHRSEEEVSGLIDQRSRFPLHPGTLHPHGATPFSASPPVMLQEPHVHPTPHDIYGPFHRHFARQRTGGRNGRLRTLPLPPPPYPGFLLHFLAMLGNPPMPYGRDFHEDATEVENYEALLNLAERLGEAKPKGLTKPEIEQLPAYRFNKENHHSDMDQTSCVVCMCDFENRQLLRVLPCSHEFHAKCVDKWLKTNRTCPICRADATEIASQSD